MRLLDEHWKRYPSVNPVQATSLGVRDHDAMLGNGPVPMDVLENQVEAWIAKRKAT